MTFVALWLLAVLPGQQLTPNEVVRIEVEVLQHYNSPIPNAGIYTAYQFASPANHRTTGPYGRFIGIVKNPDFKPLLRPYPWRMTSLMINGGFGTAIVAVHQPDGADAVFEFRLTSQQEGRYAGCWMVDAVRRR